MKKKVIIALCALAMGNATYSVNVFDLIVRPATAIALLAEGHQRSCTIKSGFDINEACNLFHDQFCGNNITPRVECFWNCPDILKHQCVSRGRHLDGDFCYRCDDK